MALAEKVAQQLSSEQDRQRFLNQVSNRLAAHQEQGKATRDIKIREVRERELTREDRLLER